MSVQTHDPLRQLFAHPALSGSEEGRPASTERARLSALPSGPVEMEPGDEVVQLLFEALKVATHNNDVAMNFSRTTQDPYSAICRFSMTSQITPKGSNWGGFSDPAIDKVCDQAGVGDVRNRHQNLSIRGEQRLELL